MTHITTHKLACACSKKGCILKGIGALAIVGAIGFLGVKAFLWENNVIVVDMNRVKKTAQVYQSILLEQRKSEEALKVRLSVDLKALQKADQELTEAKSKLAPADFRQRAEKLQMQAAAFQNQYQAEANQIVLATNIAIQSVQTQISEAIKQTAEKTGAKVVLLREATLYYDNAADETDTLISILDGLVQKADYPDLNTPSVTQQNNKEMTPNTESAAVQAAEQDKPTEKNAKDTSLSAQPTSQTPENN